MIQALASLSLWQRVFLGLIGGIITGFFLGESAQVLKPFGDLFIRLIKMIIIPLIFFSIINGMGHIQDSRQLGRIGMKAVVAYVLCTSFAIFIGFTAAWVFEPGKGMVLAKTAPLTGSPEKAVNLLEMLINIVPDNALGAMAQGSILQAFFFSFFTGVTLIMMGPKAERIRTAVKDLTEAVLTMVHMIVKLAPVAAFCLMAWCVGTQGSDILISLSKLIAAGVFAFFLQYLVFGAMIFFFGRLSPIPFYRKSVAYQTMAFATSSTKASLPMTMSVCREKLGVSKLSSSFILPLGATINMDGLAIYLGLCAITFAQAAGKVLTLGDYGTIMLTTTLGSMGGAGIPSAAIIMLPMILSSVHLPLEGVALIAGIDRIMDTLRTTISITGDAAVTVVVDNSEGMLDKEIYKN
jgi:Na+/H+-dicarboxylate symporter